MAFQFWLQCCRQSRTCFLRPCALLWLRHSRRWLHPSCFLYFALTDAFVGSLVLDLFVGAFNIRGAASAILLYNCVSSPRPFDFTILRGSPVDSIVEYPMAAGGGRLLGSRRRAGESSLRIIICPEKWPASATITITPPPGHFIP